MIDRPLKIAIVNAADRGGGAQECVWALHRGLRDLGHDSRLYVGYKYSDDPTVHEIKRVRTIPGLLRLAYWMEQNLGWQHLYAPGFRHLADIIPKDTDVLHFHSLWGAGGFADIGGVPRLTRRFPTLLTMHDEWMLTGHCAYKHQCDRWLAGCGNCPDLTIPPAIKRDGTRCNFLRKKRAMQKSAIHITTVSRSLRDVAARSPIMANKDISVIYNGIDVDTFCPGSRVDARTRLNLPLDRFIVLLAGQTIEGINQGIAQQGALALNRLNDPRVLPLLVGTSAPTVAATLHGDCVTMPFQRSPEEMALCYRAADVTLVASEVETFGRIAAESQTCGIPVITSDAGGLPEVVRHELGGLVVPAREVDGFVRALDVLLNDVDRRGRMGRDGADWAREHFADSVITRQYVDLYKTLIAGRSS